MERQNNPPPPWSAIPAEYQYRACDEDGTWFAFSNKPKQVVNCWIDADSEHQSKIIKWEINLTFPDWRNTLEKRPDDVEQSK